MGGGRFSAVVNQSYHNIIPYAYDFYFFSYFFFFYHLEVQSSVYTSYLPFTQEVLSNEIINNEYNFFKNCIFFSACSFQSWVRITWCCISIEKKYFALSSLWHQYCECDKLQVQHFSWPIFSSLSLSVSGSTPSPTPLLVRVYIKNVLSC